MSSTQTLKKKKKKKKIEIFLYTNLMFHLINYPFYYKKCLEKLFTSYGSPVYFLPAPNIPLFQKGVSDEYALLSLH